MARVVLGAVVLACLAAQSPVLCSASGRLTHLPVLTTGLSALQPALQQGSADKAVRAGELLLQARNALGGEARLKSAQRILAVGDIREVYSDQDRSGEVQVAIMLPDRY